MLLDHMIGVIVKEYTSEQCAYVQTICILSIYSNSTLIWLSAFALLYIFSRPTTTQAINGSIKDNCIILQALQKRSDSWHCVCHVSDTTTTSTLDSSLAETVSCELYYDHVTHYIIIKFTVN